MSTFWIDHFFSFPCKYQNMFTQMTGFENQMTFVSHWAADDGHSIQAFFLAYLGSANLQNGPESPGPGLWPLWFYWGTVLDWSSSLLLDRRKCSTEGARMDVPRVSKGVCAVVLPRVPMGAHATTGEVCLCWVYPKPLCPRIQDQGCSFPSRSVLWILP